MEPILIFLAICLIAGSMAAIFSLQPQWFPELTALADGTQGSARSLSPDDPARRFSLQNTLLIVGPSSEHPACRMQRRLLKPAVPLLIRENVAIIEVYGEAHPRRNGEALMWLDPALLRLALDAEDGFYVIYVDDTEKTVFRPTVPRCLLI